MFGMIEGGQRRRHAAHNSTKDKGKDVRLTILF
jgi:hypothetical protein